MFLVLSTAITFLSVSLRCKHRCVCQVVLLKKLDDGLSGTATARSTAGVNVSNKRQETIDRIDVFSAFSERLAVTQRR